ncbi:MAG: alpha/beta fold hydrolase [Gemmatimonadaceae bacterium]
MMIVRALNSVAAAGSLLAGACATQSASTDTGVSPVAAVATQEAATLTTATGDILGTLQLPAGRFPVPVVLIIAGSGPTDRDGNTPALPGKNNSLKMLAEGLAGRGIASLRYDKRGIAGSRSAAGEEQDLRFTHYVDDATAWAKTLRADERFSTVTIAGHSEGSLIGMVAAREAGVDGYVSIAGAGRKPAEIIIEQLTGQVPPELLRQSQRVLAQLSRGETPDSVPPSLFALFRPSVQPYMMSWFRFSPTDEIARLTIPVLIIQGTTDLQITEKDARLLAAANPAARYTAIEGMNHVMKISPADRQEQMKVYGDSTLPVVPRLVDEIGTFVAGIPKRVGVHTSPPFFGPDKVKHFFISAFVETFGFSVLQALGAGRNAAVAGALGTTAAVGVGRELYDRRTKGELSVADLIWDAAGAGAALLVINRTQR